MYLSVIFIVSIFKGLPAILVNPLPEQYNMSLEMLILVSFAPNRPLPALKSWESIAQV